MFDLSAYGPNLIYAATGAIVTSLLIRTARTPSEHPSGWSVLKPSALHWTSLWLSTALVALMGYIYLFVGSSRADGGQQMRILFGLIIAFGIGILISIAAIASIQRQALSRRGGVIEFGRGERRRRVDLDRVVDVRTDWLGRARLCFDDGISVAVDIYAQGAQQLLDAVEARLKRG